MTSSVNSAALYQPPSRTGSPAASRNDGQDQGFSEALGSRPHPTSDSRSDPQGPSQDSAPSYRNSADANSDASDSTQAQSAREHTTAWQRNAGGQGYGGPVAELARNGRDGARASGPTNPADDASATGPGDDAAAELLTLLGADAMGSPAAAQGAASSAASHGNTAAGESGRKGKAMPGHAAADRHARTSAEAGLLAPEEPSANATDGAGTPGTGSRTRAYSSSAAWSNALASALGHQKAGQDADSSVVSLSGPLSNSARGRAADVDLTRDCNLVAGRAGTGEAAAEDGQAPAPHTGARAGSRSAVHNLPQVQGSANSAATADERRTASVVRATVLSDQAIPAPAIQQSAPTATSLTSIFASDPTWRAAAADFARLQAANASHSHSPARILKIQLTPESLGIVTASLRLVGEQLTVEMAVESREAYHRLTAESDSIARAMRGLGFSVDQVTITLPSVAQSSAGRFDAASNTPTHGAMGQQPSGAGDTGSGGSQSGRQEFSRENSDDRRQAPAASPGDHRGTGGLYI